MDCSRAAPRTRRSELPAPLEELDGALVLLRRRACVERAEVPPPAGFRVLLARVQAVLAGLELSDHSYPPLAGRPLVRSDQFPLVDDVAGHERVDPNSAAGVNGLFSKHVQSGG